MYEKKILHDIADKDIYIYGLDNGFFLLLNFISGVFISCLFRNIMYYLIFMSTFVPLRTFSGGIHCKSKIQCYFTSTILIAFILQISEFLKNYYIVFYNFAIICSILILIHKPSLKSSRHLIKAETNYYNRSKLKILILINIILATLTFFKIADYSAVISSSIMIVHFLILLQDISNFIETMKSC